MGAASGLATVASAGLQIAGAIGQGKAAKLEGDIKAIRYGTQAEAGRVRAEQVGAAYGEDLRTSLSNILAITAGQNRGVDSATNRALLARAEDVNSRARITAMSNQRIGAISAEADADAAKRAGSGAMLAAYLKAGEGAVKFGQGVADFGKGYF